jgi:hypothetical protein
VFEQLLKRTYTPKPDKDAPHSDTVVPWAWLISLLPFAVLGGRRRQKGKLSKGKNQPNTVFFKNGGKKPLRKSPA